MKPKDELENEIDELRKNAKDYINLIGLLQGLFFAAITLSDLRSGLQVLKIPKLIIGLFYSPVVFFTLGMFFSILVLFVNIDTKGNESPEKDLEKTKNWLSRLLIVCKWLFFIGWFIMSITIICYLFIMPPVLDTSEIQCTAGATRVFPTPIPPTPTSVISPDLVVTPSSTIVPAIYP
jgi:hypothetical protein